MFYKSIFISDVHLGTKHSKTKELLKFLKETECENLFIIGDFIDGWALRHRFTWSTDNNTIFQKILRKSRHGTKIYYIPGNHDEFLRSFVGFDFAGIQIVDEHVYKASNGKKYLLIHGDKFDGILNTVKWVSKLGSLLYCHLLDLNLVFNYVIHKLGFGYFSLSHKIKLNVKEAVNFINRFESAMIDYAKIKEVDGVICGHIHSPDIKTIDGIEYLNTGCWVEMSTCIVEKESGEFELLKL